MPMMPPSGGAPPPGGGGAPIAQILQQLMQNPQQLQQMMGVLMQDPAAMQGMQAFMQGGGTGGPPPMPMDMPPQEGPPPAEGPPVDNAEQMATDQIDSAGATFDGVDAPTQNDIERLKEEPTDTMVEAFDAQFGDGASAKYLGSEGDEEAAEGEAPAAPEEAEPEYDE